MPDSAHQGGDLSSMAAKGTTIPGDAGKQNIIRSVPNPDQLKDSSAADLAGAATNPKDSGYAGDITTGTGDSLPAGVEAKRLGGEGNSDAAKGHPREGKRSQGGSEFDA